MPRLLSGYTDFPPHTCPICGESEEVRAFKVYMENGDVYSQCIPCSWKTGKRRSDVGWFIEPKVIA